MFEEIKSGNINVDSKLNNQTNFDAQKNVNLIIQIMVDGYLKSKNQLLMKDILKANNLENKPGLIYNVHIAFIQEMFKEEFSELGLSLEEEVKKHGEEYKKGELSEYESKYLTKRINTIAGIVSVIQERTEK